MPPTTVSRAKGGRRAGAARHGFTGGLLQARLPPHGSTPATRWHSKRSQRAAPACQRRGCKPRPRSWPNRPIEWLCRWQPPPAARQRADRRHGSCRRRVPPWSRGEWAAHCGAAPEAWVLALMALLALVVAGGTAPQSHCRSCCQRPNSSQSPPPPTPPPSSRSFPRPQTHGGRRSSAGSRCRGAHCEAEGTQGTGRRARARDVSQAERGRAATVSGWEASGLTTGVRSRPRAEGGVGAFVRRSGGRAGWLQGHIGAPRVSCSSLQLRLLLPVRRVLG